ncbi:MAG: choice-of-anchor D domain-containing protein, partial [bacterium]
MNRALKYFLAGLFLSTVAQAGTITNTVRDEFNAIAFTNQNGTINWANDWQEIGEVDGASAGSLTVTALWSTNTIQVVRYTRSAWRQVNLLGIATNAILSFDYRRYAYDAGEYARVMVSSNGGATWVQIDSIEGNSGTDVSTLSTNYDISAYIFSNTAIRIGFTNDYGNGESFGADNIQILLTSYEPDAPNALAVTNLNEGFEGTWSGGAPSGWTKEFVGGTLDWIQYSGGYMGQPAGAHSGSNNALLYIGSTTPNTTRMISPTVDLSLAVSATMTFWHAQAYWPSDQDYLRVYYRTNATGAWTILASYSNNIPNWTERTFTLTNLSSSYQVCFEGVAKYGYGVCVDDVRVVSEVEVGTPEMTVLGTNGAVVVNSEGASVAKGTDFGSHLWSLAVTNVFTVTNFGSGTLTISSWTTNGTGASAFEVLNMPATVAAISSSTFAVRFAPSAAGTFTAAVSIVNTSTNTPFVLSVCGTGLAAALAVSGNGVEIGDGDATPSLVDHTDFGDVAVSGGTLTRTYTITNQGATELTVSNVTISGAQSADFAVTLQPSSPVASSNSTTFQVQFDPSAVGTRTAELSFGNSDTDVNPFNFTIQGTGTVAGIGRSPTALNPTGIVNEISLNDTFGVTNVGNGTLSYAISTNATWLTVSPVSGSLGAGVGQQHTVTYNIGGMTAGTYNATISITDAAASNSPQTITV